MNNHDDWKVQIYVPGAPAAAADAGLPRDEASEHSVGGAVRALFRGRVADVAPERMQEQWTRTLDTLLSLGSEIAQRAEAWRIDEIEVGFTLSAKGELLFIAEAGAEASIKFVLKPKA